MLQIDQITYHGWTCCYRLANPSIILIITADVGPRILHLGAPGGDNIFHEFSSQAGLTGGTEWRSYGGHRLWAAPEIPATTYFPDNRPVAVAINPDGIVLTAEPEESTGIQKIIQIFVDPEMATAHLTHRLVNRSRKTLTIAPWAVTVLSPGGIAILPHGPHTPWPELVTAQTSLSLWSYTDMSGPHWSWGSRYILARQLHDQESPQKLGMLNIAGWAAYHLGSDLFIKRFPIPDCDGYPDRNSNLEIWTNHECMELETLGLLQPVEPGQSITHQESWYFFHGVSPINNERDVDQHVLPLLEKS